MSDKTTDMLSCLKEFVGDVEAAGLDVVWTDWPDIVVTYRKAKEILARATNQQVLPDPIKDKNTTPKNEAFWQGAETGLYGGRQKRLDLPTYDDACEQEIDWSRTREITLAEEAGMRIILGDPMDISSPNVCVERASDRWRLFVHIDGGDPFCTIEITEAEAMIHVDPPSDKPLLVKERVL
jgi:hypothetical protein